MVHITCSIFHIMIYLDHAATTPVDSDILDAMMPYFQEFFGNASSLYRHGQYAHEALDDARLTIAQHLECSLDEIIFTSGATESNNLAIAGIIEHHLHYNASLVPHIITSAIEHSSVLEMLKYYENQKKITVTFLPVSKEGIVSVEMLKESINPQTVLVSVQAVNNEIGTVQPIARIGRICQKNNIPFHVDAVQAVGYIPVSAEAWKCDLLSLSAHKIYGPKGIGCLFVRSGTQISPLFHGGGQERTYRPGTENVAGAVGLAKALEKSIEKLEETQKKLFTFQTFAKEYICSHLSNAVWNGAEVGENRSIANLHFSFGEHISGESLIQRLDLEGVAVSLGSACGSGLIHPSHVLLAIGKSSTSASNSLRITMGRNTQKQELETALAKIVKIVESFK